MKLNSLILLFLILFVFVSCTKNADKTDDPVNNGDTNNTSDNAPSKIVGKALVLYNSKMQYTLKASGFTSNNTCTVPMLTSDFKLTMTPSYTYSKSTANGANLVVKYADKLQMIGSNYTYSNYTYTAALSFISESDGTYTGTEKVITTGDYPALNGTSSRTISGTFTLN